MFKHMETHRCAICENWHRTGFACHQEFDRPLKYRFCTTPVQGSVPFDVIYSHITVKIVKNIHVQLMSVDVLIILLVLIICPLLYLLMMIC